MNKTTVAFKDLANRITGVSIPIFGISWTPPESERKIIRETFIFLEDRRALYSDFHFEDDRDVVKSICTIRSELTEALQRLSEESEAISSLKAMRAACREYLDNTKNYGRSGSRFSFISQLGNLRAIFGVHVAYLAVKYGIDLDGELVRIIPPEFRNAKYLEA
ncbi:MAG TPA: hypothetical protein PKW76_16940 [bacterium]|nr:hypothetical protein [bacterium]HPG47357.1 hypothetical protein [bacterium]HPM96709.1 hypothetical protein [bacterium]